MTNQRLRYGQYLTRKRSDVLTNTEEIDALVGKVLELPRRRSDYLVRETSRSGDGEVVSSGVDTLETRDSRTI